MTFALLSPKTYLIIPKALMSCYQMTLKPSKRPFMIPAKPIVFIESNLEYKILYLAAVGDSDKLKRQDQPSPGQYIYKMSGSKRSRENYFMKVLQKLRNLIINSRNGGVIFSRKYSHLPMLMTKCKSRQKCVNREN